MKDTKTVLLALLSLGLVATWVFFLAEKSTPKKEAAAAETQAAVPDLKLIQDSLQMVYAGTVNRLGAQLDSAKNTAGQLQGELNARLTEILQLKTEIAGLLKNNQPRKEDMALAGQKTTRLQQLVSGLNNPGSTPKADNNNIVRNQPDQPVIDASPAVKTEPLQTPAEKKTDALLFVATDLRLVPLASNGEKQTEASSLTETDKLMVSFAVKNNEADYDNAEVFAVVTQPDGKVIQEAWESASMNTTNGRKKYTRRLKFGYQKGEVRHLQFSLSPDDYEKGNYTLQVYHNGFLIGQAIKTFN